MQWMQNARLQKLHSHCLSCITVAKLGPNDMFMGIGRKFSLSTEQTWECFEEHDSRFHPGPFDQQPRGVREGMRWRTHHKQLPPTTSPLSASVFRRTGNSPPIMTHMSPLTRAAEGQRSPRLTSCSPCSLDILVGHDKKWAHVRWTCQPSLPLCAPQCVFGDIEDSHICMLHALHRATEPLKNPYHNQCWCLSPDRLWIPCRRRENINHCATTACYCFQSFCSTCLGSQKNVS